MTMNMGVMRTNTFLSHVVYTSFSVRTVQEKNDG